MVNQWIVVADAGRARIFLNIRGHQSLTLVRELDHPAGRAREQDLVSDQAGRLEKSGGGARRGSRSAMDPRTSAHEHEAREFAAKLNAILKTAAEQNEFDGVALIAPAHFLGYLREGLGHEAQKRLLLSAAKDLTHLSQHELEHRTEELTGFASPQK